MSIENEALVEGGEGLDAPVEKQVIEEQQEQAPQPETPVVPRETEAEKALRLELVSERKQRQDYERQMMALMRDMRPQKEPEAPKPPPSIFENEDEAINARLNGQIAPVFQVVAALSRENAEIRYTPEAVREAEAAFDEGRANGTLQMADYNAIMSSPNRYAAAVQWHQRNRFIAETGGTMDGVQAKLLSDPAFLEKAAQAYAKLKQPAPSPGQKPLIAVPSMNRPQARQDASMSDADYQALLRR